MSGPAVTRVTIPDIRSRKGGPPLVMLTAADAPTARLADEAGADILLVGDSLAMVALGHETTLSITLDEMIHHAKAVSRARPRALVVGDMPWLTYHLSVEETVRNAGRFIAEAGCGGVKIEGGRKRIRAIGALADAEIAVMGHLGLTPQSVHVMGGFRVQGKTVASAERLVREARLLADAGVFAIVLEGIPAEVARWITAEVPVPTIGIGAGPHCGTGPGDSRRPRLELGRFAEVRPPLRALGRGGRHGSPAVRRGRPGPPLPVGGGVLPAARGRSGPPGRVGGRQRAGGEAPVSQALVVTTSSEKVPDPFSAVIPAKAGIQQALLRLIRWRS